MIDETVGPLAEITEEAVRVLDAANADGISLRLLGGLMADKRVSNTDKLLVGGAIAYILLPMDFIPDYIPFLGEIDDLFVLVLALQRLIGNAPRSVLEDHWMGDPAQLRSMDLERVLVAAAFFLPRRVRRRLRTIGREI